MLKKRILTEKELDYTKVISAGFDKEEQQRRGSIFIYILVIILILFIEKINAQDPVYTQFYNNPIYYNPAMVGTNDGMIARTNYRNFWHKMDRGFNITNLTIDSEEPFLSGGIGLIGMSGIEGNGIIQSQMIGLAYSYNLPVVPRRFEIQMGLQGAWVQKKIKPDNLIFSDQLDAIYGLTGSTLYNSGNIDNVNYPDFATGFNARFNLGAFRSNTAMATINTGFAMHHITQPNESFSGLSSSLPIKYVYYSSAIIKIENSFSKYFFMMPGLIYENQNHFHTLLLGSNFKVNPVVIGIWYRNNGYKTTSESIQAIAINAGIELGSVTSTKIRINYSYDINISRYQNLLGDAHEISISMLVPDFHLFNSGKNISRRARDNRACYNKF